MCGYESLIELFNKQSTDSIFNRCKLEIYTHIDSHLNVSLKGPTYISLLDTLQLEQKLQLGKLLLHCHPSSSAHGNQLTFSSKLLIIKDFCLIWILSCLTSYNNTISKCFTDYSLSIENDNWAGWLLKYISENLMPEKVQETGPQIFCKNICIQELLWYIDLASDKIKSLTKQWLLFNYFPIFCGINFMYCCLFFLIIR